MLGALILDNFKAFGTRQVIPLAPITLIFGANSAGKSAILQSLLLLKQSLDQSGPDSPVLLGRGPLVDLGSFQDMLFGHDADRTMEIAPLIRRPEGDPTKSQGLGPKLEGLVGLGLQFGFDQVTRNINLQGLPCYVGDTNRPLFRLVPNDTNDDTEGTSPDEEVALSESRTLHGRKRAQIRDLNELSPIWQDLYGAITDAVASTIASGSSDLDGESALRDARPVLELIWQQWQQVPNLDRPESGPLHDLFYTKKALPEKSDERYELAIEAFRYVDFLDSNIVDNVMSEYFSEYDPAEDLHYVTTTDGMVRSLLRRKQENKDFREYYRAYSLTPGHKSQGVKESR